MSAPAAPPLQNLERLVLSTLRTDGIVLAKAQLDSAAQRLLKRRLEGRLQPEQAQRLQAALQQLRERVLRSAETSSPQRSTPVPPLPAAAGTSHSSRGS